MRRAALLIAVCSMTACGAPVDKLLSSSPTPPLAASVARAQTPSPPPPTPRPDTSGMPDAREGAAMAWDGARHEVVMFGGASQQFGGGTRYDETWTWDGRSWHQKHPAASPPGGVWGAMTYDPTHRQLVLFGSGCPSSTWTWDGTSWTEHKTTGPVPGWRSALAFDPALGKVLLYGGSGCGAGYNAETWSWDGSSWTRLTPGGSTPPLNSYGALAYVERDRSVQYLAPGFGESFGGGQSRPSSVWRYSEGSWSEVTPLGPAVPSPRGGAAIAYHAVSGRWLMFSGVSNGATGLSDTWTFDGKAWAQAQVQSAPQPRAYPATAYDPDHKVVIVFGGIGGGYGGFILNDTWAWDGTAWAKLG